MRHHNQTKATRREHDRVRVRTLPVEHSGTKVDRHTLEVAERRTNDINANGDRPTRETSGDHGRHTRNGGGTLPQNPHTQQTATEAKRGR